MRRNEKLNESHINKFSSNKDKAPHTCGYTNYFINWNILQFDKKFRVIVKMFTPLSFYRFDFYIITGDSNKVEVVQVKCDSIYYKDLINDLAYPAVLKTQASRMLLPGAQQQIIWDTVDSLYAIHSLHTIKTIKITSKNNKLHTKLLDSLITANTQQVTPEDKRSFLDGYDILVKIKSDKTEKRFAARSPDARSHPLLYRFLMSTVNLFSKQEYYFDSRRLHLDKTN